MIPVDYDDNKIAFYRLVIDPDDHDEDASSEVENDEEHLRRTVFFTVEQVDQESDLNVCPVQVPIVSFDDKSDGMPDLMDDHRMTFMFTQELQADQEFYPTVLGNYLTPVTCKPQSSCKFYVYAGSPEVMMYSKLVPDLNVGCFLFSMKTWKFNMTSPLQFKNFWKHNCNIELSTICEMQATDVGHDLVGEPSVPVTMNAMIKTMPFDCIVKTKTLYCQRGEPCQDCCSTDLVSTVSASPMLTIPCYNIDSECQAFNSDTVRLFLHMPTRNKTYSTVLHGTIDLTLVLAICLAQVTDWCRYDLQECQFSQALQ